MNLISSCKKEGVEDQGNGFTAALLSRFATLFNPVAPPKVPQNLFFKIDFKPNQTNILEAQSMLWTF